MFCVGLSCLFQKCPGPFFSPQSTVYRTSCLSSCGTSPGEPASVAGSGSEPREGGVSVLPPLLIGPTTITAAQVRAHSGTGSCKATRGISLFFHGQEERRA